MINKYFLAKMNIPAYLKKFLYDRYGYNEIEGIPPIIFKGNGENLLDYRIYGASGGVGDRTGNLFDKKNTEIIHAYFTPENLWQVNDDSSSIIIKVLPNTQYTLAIATAISIFRIYKTSLENPVPGNGDVFTPIIRSTNIKEYTFTTDNNTTYIIFQGTNSDVEMWFNSLILNIGSTSLPSYEPYGYKVPVVINGKNLFDGIYGANHFSKIEPDKTITISTKSTGESSITFVYKKSDGTRFNYTRLLNENETSGSATVTTPSEAVGIGIYAAADYTSQTIAYDTLIEYGDRATTYEPYHEPTTTNIYLDDPIGENESISLSDTNVNIPTIRGTNVLTVDTTVQPSNFYIKVGGF